MTEPINTVRSCDTKRLRKAFGTQSQAIINKRLNQPDVSRVVYTGHTDEDLSVVRSKLQPHPDATLQIRGQKIYEIRKRLTKNELIKRTMSETIHTLKNKGFIKGDKTASDLFKLVFNEFLGGSIKSVFRIDNKNII